VFLPVITVLAKIGFSQLKREKVGKTKSTLQKAAPWKTIITLQNVANSTKSAVILFNMFQAYSCWIFHFKV